MYNFLDKVSTRKRVLHARMSHSTVCNMTVSTKKTLRTLVKTSMQVACNARYTLSVVCGTLAEHTLVKFEIKSVTDKIFIQHGP